MVNETNGDRCIAVTNKGNRCSRVAKEGQFCFQHDSSAETVDTASSESNNIFSLVADQAAIRTTELSGVKRDIAQNMEDVYNDMKGVSGALTSLNFDEAIDAFRDATNSTAATPAKYAVVGGTAGSIGGPAGVAAGATVGAWYGVYEVASDDRAVRAQVVENVDEDVDVVSSEHPAIADIQPIQLAIQSGVETQETETEWLRSTVFRDRNMDQVAEALQEIPAYNNEEGSTEYYIRHESTGRVLRVVFGVPVDE